MLVGRLIFIHGFCPQFQCCLWDIFSKLGHGLLLGPWQWPFILIKALANSSFFFFTIIWNFFLISLQQFFYISFETIFCLFSVLGWRFVLEVQWFRYTFIETLTLVVCVISSFFSFKIISSIASLVKKLFCFCVNHLLDSIQLGRFMIIF